MSLAAAAFMYVAIATSTGALAFLVGQRAGGRTGRDVGACYEEAGALERLSHDLRALVEEAERGPGAGDGREELVAALDRLDEAVAGLRRGADLVV